MRRTAVFAVALLALAGCSSSSNDDSTVTQPTGTPATTQATVGTAVNIRNFGYQPTPLTVAAGSTITVTNFDSAEHTVTSDTGGLFTSGDANKGTPITFKAPSRPGTYTFHCKYHASMKGTLVVKS